ncbi:hypothetical protein F4778DRAFT_733248 [Xylariomycetidae sp. FL2044]|nr:hypothetical protein F4778DRAFT_733248 [Xylariomycetidae sp. FL2044]
MPRPFRRGDDDDLLETIGLPSRGDKRLLDHRIQEKYQTKIIERYLQWCTDANGPPDFLRRLEQLDHSNKHAWPARVPLPDAEQHRLDENRTKVMSILAAHRKLREGLVSTKRADFFAVQSYMFIIRLSILVKDHETYHPACLHLLRNIRPHGNMTKIEIRDVVSYLALDAACRRDKLGEAYQLRFRFDLRERYVVGLLDALTHDNWMKYNRIKTKVDRHVLKLLEFTDEDMLVYTLKSFGKTYFTVDLAFLERNTGKDWDTLVKKHGVGWELDGDRVTIRRARPKATQTGKGAGTVA